MNKKICYKIFKRAYDKIVFIDTKCQRTNGSKCNIVQNLQWCMLFYATEIKNK